MMLKPPLISVIVPVYNVSGYLQKCLNSLLSQTYENLELILVDDGSTDDSGAICDCCAIDNERVRVVHQKNRGLSGARNVGISLAHGQYLGFIDSDDWADPEMFESLYRAISESGAQIAVCNMRMVFSDGHSQEMRGGHFFATGSEAVELLVKGEQVQDYACNKLFLARLFNEVKFPEGKSFEDVATMFRLFLRAEHVVGIDKPLYNYLQRDSSIVHSGALKHEIDCYFAHFERYLLLSSGFPTVRWKLMDHLAHASVKVWGTALSDPDWRKYHPELREISQTVSDNRISILKHTQLGLAGRLVLRLIAYDSPCSFFLSRIIYIVYHWKNKN